ncbi:HtaA domain-containing protein [Protaetiibacter mangrovi]|uniref:HtaA domain-containing protein n=1 Tax=Protaetiibacter mangrovi TaxID=2970926 RepID=A0ABT1ZDM9_9MICO|nr:HtaA domain-containing protein [Protaetiibacter mangrovi]MCS0498800.1 HtaA domain-containing protein [Protaetiibacter mangrovi]TPX05241.1 hypothetical protein FJ656_07595 [Schumannella luteola]
MPSVPSRARWRAAWLALLTLGVALLPAVPAAAEEDAGCTVSDATLVWGFKESFRAYIDGSIANGEWTTAGGASYATPLFTWADGTGAARDDGALELAFDGPVRFTGHGGVLDTTVADPRIVVDAGGATLLLDVTGTTQAGDAVDAHGVAFAELDLADATSDGDTVTWTDAPATLTADGAAAFGTYPAGEPLDPVTLTATVAGGCASAVAGGALAAWPAWATAVVVGGAVILIAVAVVLSVRAARSRSRRAPRPAP